MALSKNAIYLLEQRYCRDGETPEAVFKRVSSFLFDEDDTLKDKLYNAMSNGVFLPNSPCLYNAGIPNTTLNACFVIDIDDSIMGIFKAVSEMAQIFHYGGGVGLNFSSLREKDALLRTGGTSSGVVSFMKIFDTVTETVKQGGYRRGALLGALNVNHPEIFHFVGSKIRGDLQNFNISVMVNDEFMKKAETSGKIDLISPLGKKVESVKARDLFDIICFTAWNNGDPGLLFFDRINKDNPYYPNMVINSTNPCVTGETLILTKNGYKEIKDCLDETVSIWNGWEWSEVTPKITGYNQEIYDVQCSDGSNLSCTPYHKFHLQTGVVEAKNLKIGDKLAKSEFPIIEGSISLAEKEAYTYGFFCGDGSIETNRDRQSIWLYDKKRVLLNKFDYESVNECEGDRLFVKLFKGKYTKKNFVPELPYSIKTRLGWLAGIIDSDGTLNDSGGSITITSIDKEFLLKIKRMLNTLGVNSTVSLNGEGGLRFIKIKEYLCKDCFRLTISAFSIKKLRELGLVTNRVNTTSAQPNRECSRFIKIISISKRALLESKVFCFTEPKNHTGIFNGVLTGQCGEQPLPPYGSCCLGSINIGKMVTKGEFNFERFIEYIRLGYKTLDQINSKSWYPIPEITESMNKYKPIGLGIMGFADALIKLGIYYDSQECLDFVDRIGKVFKETTEEDKTPRLYRRSLAPTGSLSILANASSGIEPIFDDAFERHLTIGVIEETRDLYKSEYTKTAHQISPEWHIKVQAQWQKWIDSGVSKTVNMPNNASVEDVKNVYKLAWMSQCKGVTIFRDGSKNTQVLYSTSKKQKCSDAECTL